ncbi:MAG TPA: Ig-like domain-containing protein, partial [Thermoanaerobaculia bacterium]|nr:Ig-like domain-containing protein [Thermoanaerobaculia bacterium]
MTFSIDRTPPAIKIDSPADGATVSASETSVHVTASGADSIKVNGIPTTGSVTVPLEIGANLVAAIATDRAGNSAADQIVVTRDDGRPGIILTSPADNAVTNRPVISVAGQVLSPAAGLDVTVNGTEVALDPSGAFFVANLPLVEGVNSISASIVSGATVTSHVTADLTPPQLTVLANSTPLQNGDRFAAAPAITLQASDDRPGVTTTVTLDGVTGDSALQAIQDGGHSLSAIARDAAGNETRVDRSFIVGSGGTAGCVVSNFDPADGSAIFANSVKMSGTAAGATAVTVNGVAASLSDGSFAAHVQLPLEGANAIEIACGDAKKTLTFFRVTGAPSITIDSPARNAIIAGSSIVVSGHVGNDVVSGDINGVPFTPANGAFSVPNISLTNGANILTARGRNAAGRSGITTTYVIRPGAPQLAITSPLPSTQTGASAIDVSGVYTNVDPSTIAIAGASLTTHAINDTNGSFIARAVPLPSTIVVNGRSPAGVTASASVDVQYVAGAPSIAVDSPADDSAFASPQDSVSVTGTISASPGAVIQLNGTQVTVDGTNHFSGSVPLATGVTPVVARISTPDGQSSSDSIRLLRFSGSFKVRDSFPAADATEVDTGALLVALFTNAVDGSSAAAAVTLADASGQSVGTTLYTDNDAISIAPNVPLAPGAKYTLTIAASLKDSAGSTLAQPFTLTFTTSASAPATPPVVDESDTAGCLQTATITGKASVAGARVRLDLDGASRTVASASDGTFRFDVTFSGAAGYHIARIREVGGDGTLSPESTVCYRISCSGPQVLAASLDRAAKRLTIQFSKPVNPSTLIASPAGTILLGSFTGSVSLNGSADTATISYDADLGVEPLTLTVTKSITDA